MTRFIAFNQRLFGRYAARLLRRSFAGVRLLDPATTGSPPELPSGPVIVAMNHASWWDPLVGLLLSQRLGHLFGGRAHAAPMEAGALQRYGFFRWLGFYPVDRSSRRGLVRFVGESEAILDRPGAALWITPQGRFADPRERPLRVESGV